MTVIEEFLMVLDANIPKIFSGVKTDYVLQSCSDGGDRSMGEKLDCSSENLKWATWICNTCEESKKKLKMQSCVLDMFLSYQ